MPKKQQPSASIVNADSSFSLAYYIRDFSYPVKISWLLFLSLLGGVVSFLGLTGIDVHTADRVSRFFS